MHRLLARQLRKLGLEPGALPDEAGWSELLRQISAAYRQSDDDRYLLERSLQISSDEMQALLQQQRATAEGRMRALVNALPDLARIIHKKGRTSFNQLI
ncbi:MAG: hypothetical protein B0D94_12250 [Candidatus Sedimenticola endophacoides]|nr:MAG: hypothetical protein B0D94_12250 [Candidatus Sedimenticola endophacoides]